MRRRLLRSGMWVSAALSLVVAGLLVTAYTRQGHISRGGVTAGVAKGRLEIAWGSGTVTRDPLGWSVSNPQGFAAALMEPSSAWRPSLVNSGLGSVPGGPGPLFEITALYVPLWPWLIVAGGMTGFLGWRAGRYVVPGHCPKCRYDLRGLTSGRCPECGAQSAGLISRILSAFRVGSSLRPLRSLRGPRPKLV